MGQVYDLRSRRRRPIITATPTDPAQRLKLLHRRLRVVMANTTHELGCAKVETQSAVRLLTWDAARLTAPPDLFHAELLAFLQLSYDQALEVLDANGNLRTRIE